MTGEPGATANPPKRKVLELLSKTAPPKRKALHYLKEMTGLETALYKGCAFSSGTIHPPSASCRTKFTECPVAISKHVYSLCYSNGPRLIQYKGIIMRRIAFANAGYRLQNQAPPICKIGVCETSPYSAFYLEIPT